MEDIVYYLVSLPKDEERRKHLNFTPDIIHYVNGKELNMKYLERLKIIENTTLKKGEIGCYLSHTDIINDICLKNKIAVVFEDDAEIPNDFKDKVKEAIENAPADYELLFLGYNYYETLNYQHVNLVHGTHCYIINGKKITNALNKLLPIKQSIDVYLPYAFKTYIITPPIITLNKYSSYSNTANII